MLWSGKAQSMIGMTVMRPTNEWSEFEESFEEERTRSIAIIAMTES
jgi:hypothetical protein